MQKAVNSTGAALKGSGGLSCFLPCSALRDLDINPSGVKEDVMKKIVLILALMLLASAAAHATPSTQIWIPSTDIQPYKKIHLGIDTYDRYMDKGDDGSGQLRIINNGLTVGVLPGEKIQMEVGVDFRHSAYPYDRYPWYFNAKIGTPEGALFAGSPAMAIGGYDFGTKKDLTDNNIVYALVAKTFGKLGRFSAGYFVGNDKVLLDASGNPDEAGVLLSWDRTMSEISDKLWFAADYQGTESGYGALNVGFAWKFAPNVGVIFGYDFYNNDAFDPTGTIQVDIDF